MESNPEYALLIDKGKIARSQFEPHLERRGISFRRLHICLSLLLAASVTLNLFMFYSGKTVETAGGRSFYSEYHFQEKDL